MGGLIFLSIICTVLVFVFSCMEHDGMKEQKLLYRRGDMAICYEHEKGWGHVLLVSSWSLLSWMYAFLFFYFKTIVSCILKKHGAYLLALLSFAKVTAV